MTGRWRITAAVGVALMFCALTPWAASAQNVGIAGRVTDETGGVLPGVTVAASSPTLIEQVRSVVTDSQGLYAIVDLRPGVYTVTFTLSGFTTLVREGIELTGSFTANVNAELMIGSLEETITVSGESPAVDIRNVVQQEVLTDGVRELLPSARSVQTMAQVIPGVVSVGGARPSPQDVGGVTGERGNLMMHGSRRQDFTIQMDGTPLYNAFASGFAQSYTFNPAEAQEYVYELGKISAAHITGGVRANVIPKEGGNSFTAFGLWSYTNESLQTNNFDDEILASGLRTPNEIDAIWDYNVAAGGPFVRDKLWFYTSYRHWGARERVAGMFRMLDPAAFTFNPRLGAEGNADLSQPVSNEDRLQSISLRLTWNANQRNKFSVYGARQPREKIGSGASGTRSYEAAGYSPAPINHLLSIRWTSPITSSFLLEVGAASPASLIPVEPTLPGIVPDRVQVRDTGTGLRYRANLRYGRPKYTTPTVTAAASYVTGSHAAKFGVDFGWGYDDHALQFFNQGMSYTLRNDIPQRITVYNSPYNERQDFRSVGLYAQDQWTIDRLTVTGGIRFDYHTEWLPEQTSGPGPQVPLVVWPEIRGVPIWKDLSPRLGVAYDLFGDGRTALKGAINRYVVRDLTGFSRAINPLRSNLSANRTWDDANGDYIPQESELGPLSNRNFGTGFRSTSIDPAIQEGWGVRAHIWEASAGIEHELVPQVSINVGYTRRWYGNFEAIDNLLVAPENYDPFCVTPPSNTRMSDVGGSQICGLFDLDPAKRGQVDNLRTHAANYGTRRETYDGIDATADIRLPNGIRLSGGISSGTNHGARNSTEACFVIDSPEAMRFCDVSYPWLTSFKMFGTFPLPAGFDASAVFQTTPGSEILANYSINDSVVEGLGRNLTSRRRIPLIESGTRFGERLYQLDVRLSWSPNVRRSRFRFILDIANALNANPVLLQNNTYGGNWLNPTYILPGRIIKPTVQIDF